MRRLLRLISALAIALAVVAFIPTPASAALTSVPQNSGGVVGLATGSRSDSIRTNVWAIEQIGNTIYVGGKFTAVTDNGVQSPRPYLAAFRADTGAWISSWQPQVNNSVNALQASPDGTKLFIGGDFTSVNGATRRYFAALDPVTGGNVNFGGQVTSGSSVRGFDIQGGWLYVVGSFSRVASGGTTTTVGSATRFSLAGQAHDPNWKPLITGGGAWGVAASPDADRVYFAGFFENVNGEHRPGGFGAVTATTGANIAGLEPFIINHPTRDYAQDVEVANGLVWVGGSEHYVYVMNESDLGLRVFHLSTTRGDFQDLEVVGDRVYAGCHCWANSTLYTRHDDVIPFPPNSSDLAQADSSAPNTWIVGFDANTGEHIPSFKPNIRSTGPGVWAIHGAPDGCLWIGGTLHKANEQPINNVVRLCDETNGGGGGTDTERPSVPGSVAVTGSGGGYVDLAWNPSTDNVGVAGYRVFDAGNNQPVFDSPTPSARFNAADGSYGLYVKAFDAAGNLSWRSGIRTVVVTSGGGGPADTTRPSVPGRPSIVASGPGFYDLTWNAASDNVGVAGYRLFDLNTGNLLADVGTNSTRLSLPAGTYAVYAKAYDAAGNQSWRSGTRSLSY